MSTELHFRTKDHPQANGRQPRPGEHAWPWRIPLEDGRTLILEMGPEGREAIAEMLTQSALDDIKEADELNRQLVEARHDARVLAYALVEGGRCQARHAEPMEACRACGDLVAAKTRHAPRYEVRGEPRDARH